MSYHSLSQFLTSLDALLVLLDFPLRYILLWNVLLCHHIFQTLDHLFQQLHCSLFQQQFLLLSMYSKWLIPQIYPRCSFIPVNLLCSSFHSLILIIHFQLASLELPQTTKHFGYRSILLHQKPLSLNLRTYHHCHLEYYLLPNSIFPVLLKDLKCSCTFLKLVNY